MIALILLYGLLSSFLLVTAKPGLSARGDRMFEYCIGIECVAICNGDGELDGRPFHYSVVAQLPQVFWKTRVFARNLETPYCYTLDGQPWPPTFNIGPPAKKSIDPNQWIQVGCLRAMNTIEIGVTDDETGIAKELIFNCCTPIWRGTYYANYAKRDIGVGDPTVQLACGPSQYREPGHRETCGRIFPEFRESTPCLMTTHCYPTYESAGEGGCVKRLRPKPFNPM